VKNRGEGKRMTSSSGEWFLAIFPLMADFVGVCPYKKGIPTVCYCEVIKPAILFCDCKKVT
jgi:hypothetical protein